MTLGLAVAVPWSLSHYIPLNGFHPLYRALFDHAPAEIEFHAWDNVKLHNRLTQHIEDRDLILKSVSAKERDLKKNDLISIDKAYQEYFWPANQALTEFLSGDIEFHHTAPYPSLKRPFVFHCESFAPVFLPFAQQGGGVFENHDELRRHYRTIFENPLCLGIFSHIPNTLESLSRFFSAPEIDQKLFNSRIGLSQKAISGEEISKKAPVSRPIFLFVNSANQNPKNFFLRGGHIVLRFWREFIASGRSGLLMLRCSKPTNEELLDYNVDVSFVLRETGRSIIWAEDYLTNHEMNALMANAHFFLLPSVSLHSASIMQAMALGTIPVVTDTVGTEIYVEDEKHGLVLRGVRNSYWHQDSRDGILFDKYGKIPDLDDSLVQQMINRILPLLDDVGGYHAMRDRAMARTLNELSGEAFTDDFWDNVRELYQRYQVSSPLNHRPSSGICSSLRDSELQGDRWADVFESATQPIRKLYTGRSVVWELGGALMHAPGSPRMKLNDWSVLARYCDPSAPETVFAVSLDEFGGSYLSLKEIPPKGSAQKLIGLISKALMRFPRLHGQAAKTFKLSRRFFRFLAYKWNEAGTEPDVELVLHGVSGFNVIRYFHKYFAIPQSEGAFFPDKARRQGYSTCYSSLSLDKVLKKIHSRVARAERPTAQGVENAAPELVMEGVHGFNIIRFKDAFFAILQADGAFDHDRVLSKGYSRMFSGSTLSEVKASIVTSVEPVKSENLESAPAHIQ